MCGIAGFLHTDRVSADERIVRRMTDLIAHRGPDASGFCVRGEVALGHRRLSIIDLSTGGQPMSNEDDSVWITYNGEIFNHADVRLELESAGHRYKSRCDTETIIHAYEQWGDRSPLRYRGMFAYVIWDENKRQLFCVRDRLGIKPFYYFWNGRLFAFASEIKALLEHPEISAGFNDALLPEYLAFGYTSGDQTLFTGIHRLLPGRTLTVRCGPDARIEIKQYWEAPCPTSFDDRPDHETSPVWQLEWRPVDNRRVVATFTRDHHSPRLCQHRRSFSWQTLPVRKTGLHFGEAHGAVGTQCRHVALQHCTSKHFLAVTLPDIVCL